MVGLLREYQEVFARSYTDMPGLDTLIVQYYLPIDTQKFQPKRQQLRRQNPDRILKIKEEVIKLINVRFIEVCNYSK